eukprot:14221810-Ditylum_brightwellii.AAC.1
MKSNLIPPFIMQNVGIEVNDVPKIQVSDPSKRDHSIYFKETGQQSDGGEASGIRQYLLAHTIQIQPTR